MLISRDPATMGDESAANSVNEQHRSPGPPHSGGSLTSPLVRGVKRQMNFDFIETPTAPCSTGVSMARQSSKVNGVSNSVSLTLTSGDNATVAPDLSRLLENITQASIYQKRMRRRNSSSSGCPQKPDAEAVTASAAAAAAAGAACSSNREDALGQAGGYKKYLRDRYLSSRDTDSASASVGNSSSSHPSVDLDSDAFTPPSAPPAVAAPQFSFTAELQFYQGLQFHQLHQLHQYRLCQSAPQTPQDGADEIFSAKAASTSMAMTAAIASAATTSLFVFPPGQQMAATAAATVTSAAAAGSTSPAGRSGGHLCRVCNRMFNRSDMLSRHARLHSNTRPYECHICPQAFSRSDHLSTHMRTHTGDKPYSCQVCRYTACRRDMITRHMKIHAKRQQEQQQLEEADGPSCGDSA